jgi:predicted AlkP superfamily pyrophosphatase or phosphodiesterase
MLDLTCIAPTAAQVLGVRPPRHAEGEALADLASDLGGCARLAIVILDGLGMATWRAAQEHTPVLNQAAGRHLLQLRSVSPPVTPVCLATIATGARPQTHGVLEREDPFKAETIFEVMREAGRTSGVAGGATCSAARVLGRWSDITRRVGPEGEGREDLILTAGLRIIEDDQPDLFLTQFLAVDSASHKYGPFTPEAAAAAGSLDSRFGRLLEDLRERGYGVLALADHGQHPIDPPVKGKRGWHDGSVEEDMIVPLVWVGPTSVPSPRRGGAATGRPRGPGT